MRARRRFARYGAWLLCAGVAVASRELAWAATPSLTIEVIMRDGQHIASASDVTMRALDGSLLRQGVSEGDVIPDDVQVSVPAAERVRIGTSTGSVTLTGATDTFHFTGRFESIAMLAPGRTEIEDRSDAYRFFGPSLEVAVHDGTYVVDVANQRATVTRTKGTVTAEVLGAAAFVMRVDTLTNARPSISYALNEWAVADTTVSDDATAAAAGDVDGEYNLGMRLYWGYGIAANVAQAMHWFEAAAAARFAEAENGIGFAYAYGKNGTVDTTKATQWLTLAAADGSGAAEDILGDMHNYGHGVQQSYADAMHWYQLAAVQGDADAENDIGLLYYQGHANYFGDAAPDFGQAMHWFRIAAAQGNADAENDIGYAYEHGGGVPLAYRIALKWYRLAAAQRDSTAEYNLGRMYENGNGVAKDYAQALYWYRLAAAEGVADAAKAIERVQSLRTPRS